MDLPLEKPSVFEFCHFWSSFVLRSSSISSWEMEGLTILTMSLPVWDLNPTCSGNVLFAFHPLHKLNNVSVFLVFHLFVSPNFIFCRSVKCLSIFVGLGQRRNIFVFAPLLYFSLLSPYSLSFKRLYRRLALCRFKRLFFRVESINFSSIPFVFSQR